MKSCRPWKISLLTSLALLSIALTAGAETVQLRDGRVLAGEVRLQGADTVIIDANYPKIGSFTLRRDELAPESLYQVLERRTDPKDAAKRRELGELAETLGLKGLALAEYRAVGRLDPSAAKDLDPRIARLVEGIADDILQDARDLLEDGNPESALMYLHSILEDYPDSKAAKAAKKLMLETHTTVGASATVATKTVSERDAPELVKKVTAHLAAGDKSFEAVRGHEGSTVAAQRAAERALVHYEKAWDGAKQLPVSVAAPELKAGIESLRTQAKAKLVEAYLTAGSIHLGRYSIPTAERYCNKACQLDPENKPNHELHGLILRAKTLGGRYPTSPQ